ncbi:MAG: TonB-dependent receptor [Bacteroidota bacterium]
MHRAILFCAGAALLLPSGFLPAQVEEPSPPDSMATYEVEEIVTTGTRTYRKIIDVPWSIERIDNVDYKYDRKTSVDNVLQGIPGVFFQNRYGNHDVRISIRGFGSRSNSGIRGVRILLDGIPESEPDGQTRIEAIDFQSVGSIEVVKGNSSSLYTNAPGGVINFLNDLRFPGTFATSFNEVGSGGLRSNGVKAGLSSGGNRLLVTYNHHTARGYRRHSEDFWHILNSAAEMPLGEVSRLNLYGYYVDGLIRLPGSLTREQYEADPFQANSRDEGRDAIRLTRKGRLGIQFTTRLDDEGNDELELLGYGTMKYFERTARTYRIMNRNGVGASARYTHRSLLWGNPDEFSVGGDLFYQYGPVEEYGNIGGTKGDDLRFLTDEDIANAGFYLQNSLGLIPDRLDFLLTARYDKVVFDVRNQIFAVANDTRRFEAVTPKAALNYKITPTVAAFASWGLSFDSPAGNELDNYALSTRPAGLLNPDLRPQKSRNLELGLKGNLLLPDETWFRILNFELVLFRTVVEDEIVPFEVQGEVFYRNAARTRRAGLEAGFRTEILKGLSFQAAYTFSDFVYESYIARSMDEDSVGNTVFTDRSFAGNRVPSVPRHNLFLALSVERPVAQALSAFARLRYTRTSSLEADDANAERAEGYALLGANAGLDWVIGNADILLSAGVNNLTDRRYVAFVNINSTSREFYEAGEPRSFFGSLNIGYRF